jgi:hypothetical protein
VEAVQDAYLEFLRHHRVPRQNFVCSCAVHSRNGIAAGGRYATGSREPVGVGEHNGAQRTSRLASAVACGMWVWRTTAASGRAACIGASIT